MKDTLIIIFGMLFALLFFAGGLFCTAVFFVGIYVFVFESVAVGAQYMVGAMAGGWLVSLIAGLCSLVVESLEG